MTMPQHTLSQPQPQSISTLLDTERTRLEQLPRTTYMNRQTAFDISSAGLRTVVLNGGPPPEQPGHVLIRLPERITPIGALALLKHEEALVLNLMKAVRQETLSAQSAGRPVNPETWVIPEHRLNYAVWAAEYKSPHYLGEAQRMLYRISFEDFLAGWEDEIFNQPTAQAAAGDVLDRVFADGCAEYADCLVHLDREKLAEYVREQWFKRRAS